MLLNEIISKEQFEKGSEYRDEVLATFNGKKFFKESYRDVRNLMKFLSPDGKFHKQIVFNYNDFVERKTPEIRRVEKIITFFKHAGYDANVESINNNIVYKNDRAVNAKEIIKNIEGRYSNMQKNIVDRIDAHDTGSVKLDPVIYESLKKQQELLLAYGKVRRDVNVHFKLVDGGKNENLAIVVSADPRVIASQSTCVPWKSCQTLPDGAYARFVGSGISAGAVIAYVVKKSDIKTLDKPLSRVLIKPMARKSDSNVYWHVDGFYGLDFNLQKIMENMLFEYNSRLKAGKYRLKKGVYDDGTSQINIDRYYSLKAKLFKLIRLNNMQELEAVIKEHKSLIEKSKGIFDEVIADSSDEVVNMFLNVIQLNARNARILLANNNVNSKTALEILKRVDISREKYAATAATATYIIPEIFKRDKVWLFKQMLNLNKFEFLKDDMQESVFKYPVWTKIFQHSSEKSAIFKLLKDRVYNSIVPGGENSELLTLMSGKRKFINTFNDVIAVSTAKNKYDTTILLSDTLESGNSQGVTHILKNSSPSVKKYLSSLNGVIDLVVSGGFNDDLPNTEAFARYFNFLLESKFDFNKYILYVARNANNGYEPDTRFLKMIFDNVKIDEETIKLFFKKYQFPYNPDDIILISQSEKNVNAIGAALVEQIISSAYYEDGIFAENVNDKHISTIFQNVKVRQYFSKNKLKLYCVLFHESYHNEYMFKHFHRVFEQIFGIDWKFIEKNLFKILEMVDTGALIGEKRRRGYYLEDSLLIVNVAEEFERAGKINVKKFIEYVKKNYKSVFAKVY